jgi:hypothetical protein
LTLLQGMSFGAPMRLPACTLTLLWMVALPAFAQEVAGEARARVEEPSSPRNYGNMRVGGSTANANGRPELCLELAPVSFLSFEGCGTGSGFLHHDTSAEVAHFRSKLRVTSFETSWGSFQPLVAAGFAELQVGEDTPGFDFSGTDRQVATAGPELGLGLRYLRPLSSGFELVGDLSLGAAYFSHAPELVAPRNTWVPSASLTFGIGF